MNQMHGSIAWIFTLLSSLFLVCVSSVHHHSKHLDEHWEQFKMKYNKTYHHPLTDNKRREAWEKNYQAVKKHNEEHRNGKYLYTLKLNHLADLSQYQYIREMVKLRSKKIKPLHDEITALPHHNKTSLPQELDWRELGFITKSLNQEECGSCYAFSIASCIQGQYFKIQGKLIYFSPQQLIDCSITSGNLGCAGGSLRNTLRYIQSAGGLMLNEDYPYNAKQSVCAYERDRAVVRVRTWGILPPKDENSLKVALAIIGPVAVSVNASPSTFQLYASGIYDDPDCSSEYVNHAMLLVGYTKEAWILKNWWTDEWGDNGYMYLARGSNKCAIANYAAYATIYEKYI